jgi:hypothetical protein
MLTQHRLNLRTSLPAWCLHHFVSSTLLLWWIARSVRWVRPFFAGCGFVMQKILPGAVQGCIGNSLAKAFRYAA